MVHFSFFIANPWIKHGFSICADWHGSITRYKHWEIEVYHYRESLVELKIRLELSGSHHAGPSIQLGLLGYIVSAKIYDTRHWSDKSNTWEN